MASGWRLFLGQPDCPDGLSRAGRCRPVTEVKGENSSVCVAAGPRGTGFLVSRKGRQPSGQAPEASTGLGWERVLFLTTKQPPHKREVLERACPRLEGS